MPKRKIHLIEERDEALFRSYEEVNKSYGKNLAPYIPVRKKVEEALENGNFFIQPETARKIICRMLKSRIIRID